MATHDRDNFDWLLNARKSNQDVLLRLYRFGNDDNPGVVASEVRAAFSLLVGASFSLWRAAFLTDSSREWPAIVSDAIKLLERLLRDNAVAYPQDRDTREWMAGYYLNNAMWRLVAAWDELKNLSIVPSNIESVDRLRHFKDRGVLLESPIELWNVSHDALVDLVEVLEKSR